MLSLLLFFSLLAVGGVRGEQSEYVPLHPRLEAFRPILGITFKGEFANSTPEKPVTDVIRYERILNGQAIRSMHSLNDGMYGGETIYRWDKDQETIVFHYFTTEGFMTTGTFKLERGRFTAYEEVAGAAGGVMEVRSTGVFTAERMEVSSEYLKAGEWEQGHAGVYVPDPDAEIVFK